MKHGTAGVPTTAENLTPLDGGRPGAFFSNIIIRGSDGTVGQLDDLDQARDWARKSTDFEIVRVCVGFLPAGERATRLGEISSAATGCDGRSATAE